MSLNTGCRLLLLSCVFLVGCDDRVGKSHVRGNVPPSEAFDGFLARDLNEYFCGNSQNCGIKYEFLRKSPTQTGVSYPKYYLWVRIVKDGKIAEEGAVRVAAIERTSFQVTDFLSREQIEESPSKVTTIFPSVLAEMILQKAHSSSQ
jgi:hypothetical protein